MGDRSSMSFKDSRFLNSRAMVRSSAEPGLALRAAPAASPPRVTRRLSFSESVGLGQTGVLNGRPFCNVIQDFLILTELIRLGLYHLVRSENVELF